MKTTFLPRKEFREKYGADVSGVHFGIGEGEHEIVLRKGASSKTRLHEIAHAELGHVGSAGTYQEMARRELDADAWVYEKLGRDPTWSELLGNFVAEVDDLLENGRSVNSVFTWLIDALEDAGYALDREDRSTVWWLVRDRQKKQRSKA